MERTESLCRECLALYRELGDTWGIASCLSLLGSRARIKGHYGLACSLLEEAEVLFGQLGDRWKQGRCHVELAWTATEQGQYERAAALLSENLKFCQVVGDQLSAAWVQFLLARTLFVSQHDKALAQRLAEQSLAFLQELGYDWLKAYPLSLLAQMHLAQGELGLARERFEESLVIVQEVGDREGAIETWLDLGRVEVAQGDLAVARRRYQEALTILQEMGSQEFLAACLEGLAALEAAQGAPSLAARLWGTAEVLREVMGTPMHPVYRANYEQVRAQARAALSKQAFRTAWAEGRAMTPQQALVARAGQEWPTIMPQHLSAPPSPLYPAGLTAREVEVLRLIAQGWTDAQIAERLIISPRTVNRHTTSLYSKLSVSSRASATRYAIEHHLL